MDNKKEIWRANLTEKTQGRYGGYQDLALDESGRAFVIGTFPGSILRINSDGSGLTTWWGPSTSNYSVEGITGIAKFGSKFLAPDATSGKLYRFDMRDDKGQAKPVKLDHKLLGSDGIHLPPLYNNRILLVTVHPELTSSAVAVLESRDGKWNDATYLGQIDNKIPNSLITAAFSLGDQIYMLPEFFAGDGKSGNMTQFPMVDITKQINKLVEGSHHHTT